MKRKLSPLDEAFGMDQAALDSATLRDGDFNSAERQRRRAKAKLARIARRRNR